MTFTAGDFPGFFLFVHNVMSTALGMTLLQAPSFRPTEREWRNLKRCLILNNMKQSTVYFLSNKNKNVLYIGVTSNLAQRLEQHKISEEDSFSKKYNTDILVYIENFPTMEEVIAREKQLKKWRREKKNALVENINPDWKDLRE